MKKTKVTMNNSAFLGLPVLGASKILMFEYTYDCAKAKYGKLHIQIKSEDVYADLVEDVKTLRC